MGVTQNNFLNREEKENKPNYSKIDPTYLKDRPSTSWQNKRPGTNKGMRIGTAAAYGGRSEVKEEKKEKEGKEESPYEEGTYRKKRESQANEDE
jgi:hypothetical protein